LGIGFLIFYVFFAGLSVHSNFFSSFYFSKNREPSNNFVWVFVGTWFWIADTSLKIKLGLHRLRLFLYST